MDNKNGGIFTYTHFNNKVVGIVSLSCETDFAEKTEAFKKLGESLANQAAVSDTDDINEFLKEVYVCYDATTVKKNS